MSDLAINGNFASASNFLQRYAKLNEMLDAFWQRLIRELSPQLRSYPKWTGVTRDIQVDDIGVILDESKRNHFPLVRVTKVHPSKDGHVRSITVTDGRREALRSISKFSLVQEALDVLIPTDYDPTNKTSLPCDPATDHESNVE